jgi:hypothetical protein
MKQKLIFSEKEINVYEETYSGFIGISYFISDGKSFFTVWAKPVLEYESLKKEIAEYEQEKLQKIAEDAANAEKSYNWEDQTEEY